MRSDEMSTVRLEFTVEGMRHSIVQALVDHEGAIREQTEREVDAYVRSGALKETVRRTVRDCIDREVREAVQRAVRACFGFQGAAGEEIQRLVRMAMQRLAAEESTGE